MARYGAAPCSCTQLASERDGPKPSRNQAGPQDSTVNVYLREKEDRRDWGGSSTKNETETQKKVRESAPGAHLAPEAPVSYLPGLHTL